MRLPTKPTWLRTVSRTKKARGFRAAIFARVTRGLQTVTRTTSARYRRRLRWPRHRPPRETAMQEAQRTDRYAKCIEVSKRVRWDIDRDVIRGRSLDFAKKFLPDGLSKVGELD